MIVWRITGNEVGPNGNGANFFQTESAARAYAKEIDLLDQTGQVQLPERITVKNRKHLVAALIDAMGYGAS